MTTKKIDLTSSVDAMQKYYTEQHQQIIEEQKAIFEGYKDYFGSLMDKIEAQQQAILDATEAEREREEREEAQQKEKEELEKKEKEEKEKSELTKEIGDISNLLDEAVKMCSKEIPVIISQLLDYQQETKVVTKT